MNDGEMEQRVRVLQDELQQITADRDSKIAMGREMETQLHSTQTQLQATQMELGFVQKQLTTLQKQYQDVLEQAGYYRAQCDTLQKQPASLATSTSTPPLPEPAHTIITTKRAKLPDPPVFMGNLQLDDISLDIWKIKMADKIGQDEARYPNALAQLCYIFLQVGGAAQAQLELYAENDYTKALSNAWQHPDIPAYQTMFTILDNAFGDPDRANTARTKLAKLNQGRKPFAEHYAKFMRYAPKTGYDESSLLHMLRLQLSQELGTALSYQANEPQSIEEMVRLCQSLDNRQRAEQNRQKSRTVPAQTPMGCFTSTSSYVAPTPLAASTATGRHSGPMDTSAGKSRAKWVTPEILAERRAKGICVHCGSKQHFVGQCMLLPAHRPQAAAAQMQAAAVPKDAEVEVIEVESKNE